MPTINERKKDFNLICIIILSFLTFFSALIIDNSFFRAVIIGMFIFSFLGGFLGRDRKIGFGYGLIATYFLGIIGVIIVLVSPRLKDEEYKGNLLGSTAKKEALDHLIKLNELKKEGILTEEEFAIQKKKILDEQ